MAATVATIRGSCRGRNPLAGNKKKAGVQFLRAIGTNECPETRVKTPRAHVGMDAVAHLAPFLNWPRQLEYLRAADRAVESNPRHRLGMREVFSATADFPQTLVRLVPDAGKVQQKFALHGPALFVSAKSALPRLMQRVHDLAKNIELKLVMRSVADTHRLRIFIAGKPGHFPFGQAPLAAQAVH